MKKILICLFISIIMIGSLFADESRKVLLVYEESNEQIDPWLVLFRETLSEKNFHLQETIASEIGSTTLSSYDYILIYGTVMAFTMKEPVRKWLKSDPSLAGKDVLLFVTTSRWFARKYTNELVSLIRSSHANLIDAVSSATNELTLDEKKTLVKDQVRLLK